jgi:hypothetical protein
VIPRSQLPEDAADWRDVAISFPRLAEDGPTSCPHAPSEIFACLQDAGADLRAADRNRLVFARTAQVAAARYWLWTLADAADEPVFVVCRVDPDGSSCLGLARANGLSPDQFLLAEYYDAIHWS